MARIRLLRASRNVAILATGAAVGTFAPVSPFRTVYAEAPAKDELPEKKPMYSPYPVAPTIPKPSSTSPVSQPDPIHPTPTDRLTEQVKKVRVFLYHNSLYAETSFNSFLTWAFRKETDFSNTVASLAPSPETGEQLLPGVIYVLVATLTGSIVSRNRGIILRTSVPLAVGIAAGWYLIPVTMRNTSDLIWEYEKRVPVVAETHRQVGALAREAWAVTRGYTQDAAVWADEKAVEARRGVEELVSKGK